MTIKEAVIWVMKKKGFTGLFNNSLDCGCEDDDIMPCYCSDSSMPECEFGYKVKCTKKCDHEHGETVLGQWHIQKTKPRGNK